MAGEESMKAYPSVEELCYRTELNRKTVIAATKKLLTMDLLIDSLDRKGTTKQVIVYYVPVFPLYPKKDTENGTVQSGKESRFYHETVPNLPSKSPVFSSKSPKNGTRNPINPPLTLKEPKELSLSDKKMLIESHITGVKFCLERTTRENTPDYAKEVNRLTKQLRSLEDELQELGKS